MTEQVTVVQARVPAAYAHQIDEDIRILGLGSRSDAVRAGLRLLHRQARDAEIDAAFDDFYGAGVEAPLSELGAIGDVIAAEAIAARERDDAATGGS